MANLEFPRLPGGVDAVAERIDSTRWGAEFTWHQIETLAKYCQVYRVPEGAVIVQEGIAAAHLCIVATGRVAVTKTDEHGHSQNIAEFGAGKAFGEMSLVDGEPSSASVRALTDSELVVMSVEGFAELKSDVPRLALVLLSKIARMMSQRLRQTSGELIHLRAPED